MFGRRRRASSGSGAEVFDSLREQFFGLDPAEVGLTSSTTPDEPWGFAMETGYDNDTASLVCLRDGTSSLYTSSGFGIIGGGDHESVRVANARLFAELDAHVLEFQADESLVLPADGYTALRVLTYNGRRIHEALELELGEDRDPLSPVFYGAHDVITELRLISESGR